MSSKEKFNFNFVYNCDLDDLNLQIKIVSLEGIFPKDDYKKLIEDPFLKYSGLNQNPKADIYLTVQLFTNGQYISPIKRTTFKACKLRWDWNEWIVFPYKFSELSRDTMIVFKIHDSYYPGKERVVGVTSISIFGKYGALRRDIYDLKIHHDIEEFEKKIFTGKINKFEVCYKLNKLKNKYHDGYLPKVDWLDKLTFREIEKISQEEKTKSKQMFLSVEFPKIIIENVEYSVVFFEKNAEENCKLDVLKDYGVLIYDDELLSDNLVEIKHHQLSRSARSGVSDRDLKPNALTRDLLNTIVAYPPTKILTAEEEDLIWKFRFYLMNQKKALTKFLKCVKWDSQSEAKQAIDLLFKWELMDIEDALELLSPQFSHPTVRKYAVSRLKDAPNEDLILYLLQLVQALKYENFDDLKKNADNQKQFSSIDLLDKDIKSLKDTNKKTELNESRQSIGSLTSSSNTNLARRTSLENSDTVLNDDDLAGFLINRACQDETFANYFFWYLMVECGNRWKPDGNSLANKTSETDERFKDHYLLVMSRFSNKLTSNENLLKLRNMLLRQKKFVRNIILLMKKIAGEKGGQQKKAEKLQLLLHDQETFKMNFLSFDSLPLPLDPEIKVKGIIPEKTTLFKSALNPIKLTFITNTNEEYVAIVKHGDDLRQDQLILQTITLMDKLLRKENLDLKLTPYRVLATSIKNGFVQYVDSLPVAEILKNYDIQTYLKICAPSENNSISTEIMDNYIKSCAGYCIITYILGVGDRHFDNLMLTKNGNLFHIDFGYILGRDPKPFPPPMKLSKEMVEAMGGINSDHYQQFRKLCYTAFLHLRRHSNLILNLFNLMIDANIPDIALEPDKTVKKIQDKFRLDLNDEEAVHYIQSLIDVSVTAVMAAIVEQFHKIAQFMR